nr:hypothetical protein [Baekduia alba]
MPELTHHVGRVLAEREQDRRERVPQLVGGHADRQRHRVGRREDLAGAGDDRREHLRADVVLVARGAGRGREHQGVALDLTSATTGLVREQLVAEDGPDVDLAVAAGIGLRLADRDAAAGEVDIAPTQLARLADAEPREDERGDQRAPARRPCTLRRVDLARRLQERGDVLGGVEVHRPLLRDTELAVARVDPQRVAVDETTLLSDIEDLAEARERLVDGVGTEAALADLVLAVAVDLRHGDLREQVPREERQQVHRQLVLVRVDGVRAHSELLRRPPLRREHVERRVIRRQLDLDRRRRDPLAALDLQQDVGQLATRLIFGRAVGHRHVAALAVGAESQGVHGAALRLLRDDLAGRSTGHQVSRSLRAAMTSEGRNRRVRRPHVTLGISFRATIWSTRLTLTPSRRAISSRLT